MQSEDIKVAICDDEEFYRSQLDDMVSVYGNEMDVNMSIDLYDNAKELMNNIFSQNITKSLSHFLYANVSIELLKL